jgi:hypothetical protein
MVEFKVGQRIYVNCNECSPGLSHCKGYAHIDRILSPDVMHFYWEDMGEYHKRCKCKIQYITPIVTEEDFLEEHERFFESIENHIT